MWIQSIIRRYSTKPVIMSSLVQLPFITATFNNNQQIAILTANSKSLFSMEKLICEFCGVDLEDNR